MNFRDRLMNGAYHAPEGAGGAGGSGGTGGSGDGNDFTALLSAVPEPVRAHPSLKEARDVGSLVRGLATLATPKPAPAAGSKEAREAFLSNVPERIRGEAAFKDIHDVGALADSYYNAQKLVGLDKAKLLRLPNGPDDADGIAAFNRAVGVPEAADKYAMPDSAVKKLPQGQKHNEEFIGGFRKTAHGLGISQRQHDGLIDFYMDHAAASNAKAAEAAQAENTRVAAAFKAELGEAHQPTLELAHGTIRQLAKDAGVADAFVADLTVEALAARPDLARLFAHIGKMNQEDRRLAGKDGGSGGGGDFSPTEAKQQIAAKQGDADFMKRYRSKREPGHADAVTEMAALYDMAFPGGEGADPTGAEARANPGGARMRAASSRRGTGKKF